MSLFIYKCTRVSSNPLMLLVYIPKGLSRYLIDHLPECLITYFSRKFELNAFEFKECLYSVSCSVCLISLSRFHCFATQY